MRRLVRQHSNVHNMMISSYHTAVIRRSRHESILSSYPTFRHRYYDLVRTMSTATDVKPKTEIDTLLEEVSSEIKPTKKEKTIEEKKTEQKSEEIKTETVTKQKPPLWTRVKDEAKHYWFGTKLLFTELRIATRHLSRVLQGHSLSRRERKQLVRTANDMMRLVPFSIFVLIPFMELLLPVALAIFPGLLPSTYTTSKKRSENMKRRLRARIEMASFLQDVMEESAKDIKSRNAGSEKLQATADDLLAIVEKARQGHPMSNESVLTISKLFQDDITLDTMSRPQLVTLCHFVGITVFGTPSGVMRMQLRAQLRAIKADDRMIMWEGIHVLNKTELEQACQDRGMRATGLSEFALRHQLQQWLDLSVRQDLPLAFLILSRAMTITASADRLETLGRAIGQMEEPVVKEAVRKTAVDGKIDPELQIETLEYQSKLIEEEEKSKEKTTERAAIVKDKNEEEEEMNKLTLEEIEALNVLASESAVEKERAEIQQLKEELEELTEELMESAPKISDIRVEEVTTDKPDGWDTKMEKQIGNRLRRMLSRLEDETEEVDEEIGDELFVIDRDQDGKMTVDELRDAVQNVLNTRNTDEETDAVMKLLDRDGDGEITKHELLYFTQKTRQKRLAELGGDDDDEEEDISESHKIRRL